MNDKKECWIMFSIENAYDQPEKAFEKLFWTNPFELEAYKQYENGARVENSYNDVYWIEHFTDE